MGNGRLWLALGIALALIALGFLWSWPRIQPAEPRVDGVFANGEIGTDRVAGADVLYIGDSESLGYFGDRLYLALSAQRDPASEEPLRVGGLWVCGSDVEDWESGGTSVCGARTCDGAGHCARDHRPANKPRLVTFKPLAAYLGRARPQLTIVALGANMLTLPAGEFRASYGDYLASAARVAAGIARRGSRCIWIGPPQPALFQKNEAQYETFAADLRRVTTENGCRFIDSDTLSDRRYVRPTDVEGVHYQKTGELQWESKVWLRLKPMLTEPR